MLERGSQCSELCRGPQEASDSGGSRSQAKLRQELDRYAWVV